MRFLRTSWLVRSTMLGLLVIWLSACAAKQVAVEPPYAETINEGNWDRLLVTLQDGSDLTVRRPTVRNDSIVGWTPSEQFRDWKDSVYVSLADVTMIKGDKATSPVLIVASVAALIGLMYAVARSAPDLSGLDLSGRDFSGVEY